MKIYIVQGTAGEYEDRTDWVVCAFKSKKKAEDLIRRAQTRANEIDRNRYDSFEPDSTNEFDPKMVMLYSCTGYYLIECELKN